MVPKKEKGARHAIPLLFAVITRPAPQPALQVRVPGPSLIRTTCAYRWEELVGSEILEEEEWALFRVGGQRRGKHIELVHHLDELRTVKSVLANHPCTGPHQQTGRVAKTVGLAEACRDLFA